MKTSIKVFALLALITQIALLNIQLRKKAIVPEGDKTIEKDKDKTAQNDTSSTMKKEEENKEVLAYNGTVKKDDAAKNMTSMSIELTHRKNDDDHEGDSDKDDIDYYDDDGDDNDDDDKDDKDSSQLEAFDEDKFKKEVEDIKNKAKTDKTAIPQSNANANATSMTSNTTMSN